MSVGAFLTRGAFARAFRSAAARPSKSKVPRDQRRALNRKIPGRAEAMKNARRILDSYPLFMVRGWMPDLPKNVGSRFLSIWTEAED
jgi:hypothetical protein